MAALLISAACLSFIGPHSPTPGTPLRASTLKPTHLQPVILRAAHGSLLRVSMLEPASNPTDRAAPDKRGDAAPESKPNLAEKMQSWEATDEERRASTLGGLIPGKIDGFDLTLNFLFPIMLVACLGIALFPLWAGLVVGDAPGPPPQ
jgi:hypothetical protein